MVDNGWTLTVGQTVAKHDWNSSLEWSRKTFSGLCLYKCVIMITTFTRDQVLHKQRMLWRTYVVEAETGEGGIGARFGRLTRRRQDNGRRRRRQWVSVIKTGPLIEIERDYHHHIRLMHHSAMHSGDVMRHQWHHTSVQFIDIKCKTQMTQEKTFLPVSNLRISLNPKSCEVQGRAAAWYAWCLT